MRLLDQRTLLRSITMKSSGGRIEEVKCANISLIGLVPRGRMCALRSVVVNFTALSRIRQPLTFVRRKNRNKMETSREQVR